MPAAAPNRSPKVRSTPAAISFALVPVNKWRTFWSTVTRYEADKVTPWLGLRNSIGVAAPIAIGIALGSPAAGLAIATGSLNVSFSDGHQPYRQRARRMGAASVLVALAVFLGVLSHREPVLSIFLCAAWSLAAGLLVALSTEAADLGTVSLVTLIVYAAQPIAPDRALGAAALALLGGLLQIGLALLLWPVRRNLSQLRDLAAVYSGLARSADSPPDVFAAPPAGAEVTQAQHSLASLGRDPVAERYRSLLNQAERMRLSLLALARLRARLEREAAGSAAAAIVQKIVRRASVSLSAIGDSILSADPSFVKDAGELEPLAEDLHHLETEARASSLTALLRDAGHQADALAGQIRAAADLAAIATPAGDAALDRAESGKPWSLRRGGTLATLRANLSLGSAAFRHAVRLAVCVAAGEALARGFFGNRGYWLPMTVAIVLKPDFTSTFSRGVLRLAGTLIGLVLTTAFFHLFSPSLALQAVLIAALTFALRSVGQANYGIFVVAISALIVFLVALTGAPPQQVILARGLTTAAGGALALVAYWLWPTWERTQTSEVMAQLLDAYRDYFRAVSQAYLTQGVASPETLDRARHLARLARSNQEASFERLRAEEGFDAHHDASPLLAAFAGMLASSHRFVHAVMALEAGVAGGRDLPTPRPQFRTFANHVELTLYLLAAVLRGSRVSLDTLPSLREDHRALLHASVSPHEVYSLVNVETDRIANSLNTLCEQALPWLAAAPAKSG